MKENDQELEMEMVPNNCFKYMRKGHLTDSVAIFLPSIIPPPYMNPRSDNNLMSKSQCKAVITI